MGTIRPYPAALAKHFVSWRRYNSFRYHFTTLSLSLPNGFPLSAVWPYQVYPISSKSSIHIGTRKHTTGRVCPIVELVNTVANSLSRHGLTCSSDASRVELGFQLVITIYLLLIWCKSTTPGFRLIDSSGKIAALAKFGSCFPDFLARLDFDDCK